jgi:selenocysteine-specific elongation factor
MLAGASGLDLAMLVIAADDSVMPQTREHLEILKLLGLSGGVIVITKCDLAEESWLEMVEDDARALVQGSFLEGAKIVRTSAPSGVGIERLRAELAALCSSLKPRADKGVFRMAIDRSFSLAGHGTVVTGTVASGSVAVGDELEWLPAGRPVRVRGLHRHDRPVERAGRGARAAINLAGVRHGEVHRGHELAAPGFLKASQSLSVELIGSADAIRPFRHRGRYKLHLGTAEVSVVLALLEPADTGDPLDPKLAQLFAAEPIVAVHGQPFVLRQESPPATLGGGRILQPEARRIRRRDEAAIDRLRDLRSSSARDRLRAALGFLGLAPWTPLQMVGLAGLDESDVAATLAGLTASGELIDVPIGPRRTISILADVVGELEERALRALNRLHAARPRHSAIPRAQLTAAFPDVANEALLAGVIERLEAQGKVTADARTVAVRGFQPKLSQAERKLKAELVGTIRAGGMSPPEVGELVANAGPRAGAVSDLLALLRDEDHVVEISGQLYLDCEVEAELRRRVSDRFSTSDTMTMSELRDLLGTTRKYAVPIGEYLDRIGWTKRDGDVRRRGTNQS